MSLGSDAGSGCPGISLSFGRLSSAMAKAPIRSWHADGTASCCRIVRHWSKTLVSVRPAIPARFAPRPVGARVWDQRHRRLVAVGVQFHPALLVGASGGAIRA